MKQFLLTLLLLLGWGSCVQDLPVTPPTGEYPIAVSCILSNRETQELRLTKSSEISQGYFFDEVEEAQATLYQGEQLVGHFTKTGYGIWTLKYQPVEGTIYRLEVKIPGKPTLTASTTMPQPEHITRRRMIDNNHTKVFTHRTHRSPLWMFALASSYTDSKYHYAPQPTLEQDTKARLFQDIGTDHLGADRFNQVGSSNDFDKRYGNTPAYRRYVRIMPDHSVPEEQPYTFRVQIPFSPADFVVFRTASEEYDRYLKSVIEKTTFYQNEEDPLQWFDESVVYSNINNGLGIFGAYHQSVYYFNNSYEFD